MQVPACWLISGIPGAGKTTVAQALAASFSTSAHIEGDKLGHDFIVNGLVPPDAEPADEARRQVDLRRSNIRLLADSFAQAGFTPVIDDVIANVAALEGYRQLATRPIAFVQLLPAASVVLARDADRDKQVAASWLYLDDEVRAWSKPRPGLWLDTSDLTAAETVSVIQERTTEALLAW